MNDQIVGYRGKSGKLRAYKKTAEAPDKFNPGQRRVKLESFDGELVFWVSSSKLEAAPTQSGLTQRSRGCSCNMECCQPRCHCETHCNCRGGHIFDC